MFCTYTSYSRLCFIRTLILVLSLECFFLLNTACFFSILGQLVIAKVFVGDTELARKEERFEFYSIHLNF